jgi:hypothetical protein
VAVSLMESSILSEVNDTSILRTGLSTPYRCPLDWLPASRLMPPRSGLERSDFVPWPFSKSSNVRFSAAVKGQSGHQSVGHFNEYTA